MVSTAMPSASRQSAQHIQPQGEGHLPTRGRARTRNSGSLMIHQNSFGIVACAGTKSPSASSAQHMIGGETSHTRSYSFGPSCAHSISPIRSKSPLVRRCQFTSPSIASRCGHSCSPMRDSRVALSRCPSPLASRPNYYSTTPAGPLLSAQRGISGQVNCPTFSSLFGRPLSAKQSAMMMYRRRSRTND